MKFAFQAVAVLAALTAFSLPASADTYQFRQPSKGLVSAIVQVAPTLGAFSVPAKNMGDAAFALTPPASNSPGAFTYVSSNPSVATVSGNMVTLVAAGTAQITATQAATANYLQGSAVATLTVGPAPLPPGYITVNGYTWMPASSTKYTYTSAVTLCKGTINGSTGWRVPNATDVSNLNNAKVAGTSGLTPGGWQVNYFWSSQTAGTGQHVGYALPDNMTGMATSDTADTTTLRATCVK